jgi:carboxyl-terminal processing protease
MILRIPEFIQMDSDVDSIFKKARTHKTLIVDLRGTPGGLVDSVVSFLGDIFTQDVKIGDWVQRNKIDPLTVKNNHREAFTGDLIVLIDSKTASGGEIFARVVQLQERGTIIGDHSSGRTMESREYIHESGENPIYTYGASVTIGDTVMADGKSIEHVGVEPDRAFLPTAADLAAGRDPVLAFAAGLSGMKLSPADAAKLFPGTLSDE